MSRRTVNRIGLIVASLLALALFVAPGAMAKRHDRNGDRIPDRWEKRHHLSLKVNQARKDQDNDGLRNRGEFRANTDPRDSDTDDDGVGDEDEDRDRDRVDNGNEQAEHTDPADRDSDDDGVADGKEDREHDGLNNAGEDASGNDPVDPDTDDDGIEDGDENAGVIASYDPETHVLRIELFGGDFVSGLVTEGTRVSCESEDEHEDSDEGDGPGDEGAEEPGDGPSEEGDGEHSDGVTPASEDGGEEPGEDGEGHACSADDLTPGTPVHEAELEATGDGLVYTSIELVK